MKRCIIFTAFSLIIFSFGILFGYLQNADNPTEQQSAPAFSQTTNTPSPKSEDRVFLLISSGNNIDVFSVSDKNEPYLYSTIEYIDLNSIDKSFKDELQSGISLKGETALANYIQDLDS